MGMTRLGCPGIILSGATMRFMSFVVSLALAFPALGADISTQPFQSGDGVIIRVSGQFDAGDDKKLTRALLETHGQQVVVFESPGGSLLAGLAMGRAIRIQGAHTAVDDGAACASACGLAWLGGVRRLMGHSAKVGFHAAYYVDDQGRAIETGQGNALIGAYLNQLGLSEKAVLYITQAAPAEMTWLNFDDADDLGIPVRPLGGAAPTPAAAPSAPPQASPPREAPKAVWRIKGNVSGGYMNVRSGPGTMHGVLFTVPAGARGVQVDGCQPADPGGGTYDWCRIVWQGQSGWVSSNGLEQ